MPSKKKRKKPSAEAFAGNIPTTLTEEGYLTLSNQLKRRLLIEGMLNNHSAHIEAALKYQFCLDTQKDGMTPLLLAILRRKENLAKRLIECGAKVNIKHHGGVTVLIQATRMNLTPIAIQLLQQKADPNAALRSGKTALQIAIAKKNTMLAQQLIDAKASIDSKDGYSRTLLLLAAWHGVDPMIPVFLNASPLGTINGVDKSLNSVLHSAIRSQCSVQTIDLLLKNGADVDARDRNGYLAVTWAVWLGSLLSVQCIIPYMARNEGEYDKWLVEISHGIRKFFKKDDPKRAENFDAIITFLQSDGKRQVLKLYNELTCIKQHLALQTHSRLSIDSVIDGRSAAVLYCEHYDLLRYCEANHYSFMRNQILEKLNIIEHEIAPKNKENALMGEDTVMQNVIKRRSEARKDLFNATLGLRHYWRSPSSFFSRIPQTIVIHNIVGYFRQGAGIDNEKTNQFINRIWSSKNEERAGDCFSAKKIKSMGSQQ